MIKRCTNGAHQVIPHTLKISWGVLLLILMNPLLVVSHIQAEEVNKEITITTQQWPPYQFESNRIQSGFAISALSCVMKRLNQDYRVIFLPWGRAQNGVAQGKYDGFFSASQNSTRDSYAVHSNTFIEQQWNFYLLKDTKIALDKQAIKQDAKFGSRKHANTTYWLKKNGFKVVYETTRVEELIKLLQTGKIDGIMENKLLFSDAANRAHLSMSQFKVVPNINKPLGVYFGKVFLQNYPGFLKQFNTHTEACRFETYD